MVKSCHVKQTFFGALLGAAALFPGAAETLCAQDLSLTFNYLSFDKRLPKSDNYFISQDTFGFIWIGTGEGLYRFDGQNLKSIPLSPPGQSEQRISKMVTSRCFEDAAKNLWFSTASSVSCYRRATGNVQLFPAPAGRRIAVFHLDTAEMLWLKADSMGRSELYLFDTRACSYDRRCPLEGEQFAVQIQKNGKVSKVVASMLPEKPGFVVTDVLQGFDRKFVELIKPNGDKFKKSHPSKKVWIEGDSIAWVGLYNGIGKYDLNKTNPAVAHIDTIEAAGWISEVFPYNDSLLLAASEMTGLAVFNKRTKRFVQKLRHQTGVPGTLPQNEITGLYRDASDDIWLSDRGMGIAFAHLRKNKFPRIPETVGILVSSLFKEPGGDIWCSSRDSGVYIFTPGGKLKRRITLLKNHDNRFYPLNDLPGITCFWKDQEHVIWGLYENNALPLDTIRWRFEFWNRNYFGPHNSAPDLFRTNCRLDDGTHLFVRGKEVFQWRTHNKAVDTLRINLDTLGLHLVSALFQSRKGDLYIADNPDRILVLKRNASGNWGKQAQLTNTGDCTAFAETSDGRVWAAGSEGLYRIDPTGPTISGCLLTEAKDGVPNERYYNILPDGKGNLWLTGLNGLVRFEPERHTFHRFGMADGLLSGTFSQNAAIADPTTGYLWVGGVNGINVFRPEAIRLLDDPPKIQIADIMVNDTPYHIDRDLCLLNRLELNYTQNTLSFQFAALDFSAPGQNQYFCLMHGVDRDTIFLDNRGFVRYANIRPGHYKFEVWGTNSDGIRCTAPRQLELYIRPPFWETWWFYLLCALAVAGLIYAWFQYRLQQALKIERMRVQISSDLHDEVGVLLSGLAMQSELLERTAQEKDKTKLQRISAVSRDAMARMRDTVWAIDSRRGKLENLIDRMREHAEETLGPHGMRFRIQAEDLDVKRQLSIAVRQNIYLIYKEAVTNIAKHSNGDTVQVSLKKAGKGLEMRICDNGTALGKAYKTTGLGLSNMQLRAEKIGGTLEINREGGFCVILRLRALD